MTRIGPCPICPLAGTRDARQRRLEAGGTRGLGARLRAFGKTFGHPEEAIGRAGGALAAAMIGRDGTPRSAAS